MIYFQVQPHTEQPNVKTFRMSAYRAPNRIANVWIHETNAFFMFRFLKCCSPQIDGIANLRSMQQTEKHTYSMSEIEWEEESGRREKTNGIWRDLQNHLQLVKVHSH